MSAADGDDRFAEGKSSRHEQSIRRAHLSFFYPSMPMIDRGKKGDGLIC
jgi:hypothetical protein